jgi:hypothetical protein
MVTSTRTTCRHDVRSITFQDAPPVADVLARAFADDPVVAWSIPDPSWREARSPEHFSVILDLYLPKGHVYADARLRSAALWAPPEDRQVRASQIVRLLPRLARLYRHRLPLVLAGLVRVQRIQSDEPCWYLAYLGTDPDHQGRASLARSWPRSSTAAIATGSPPTSKRRSRRSSRTTSGMASRSSGRSGCHSAHRCGSCGVHRSSPSTDNGPPGQRHGCHRASAPGSLQAVPERSGR